MPSPDKSPSKTFCTKIWYPGYVYWILTSFKLRERAPMINVHENIFIFSKVFFGCGKVSILFWLLNLYGLKSFVYNETILGETHLEWNSFKLLNFLYNETILGEKSQKSALKEDYIRYIPPWQGTFAYHCSFIKLYAKVIRCCTLVKCLYQYYVIIT